MFSLHSSVRIEGPYLRFFSITPADAGRYLCSASNRYGNTTKTAEVVVNRRGPYLPTPRAQVHEIREGDDVTLTCNVGDGRETIRGGIRVRSFTYIALWSDFYSLSLFLPLYLSLSYSIIGVVKTNDLYHQALWYTINVWFCVAYRNRTKVAMCATPTQRPVIAQRHLMSIWLSSVSIIPLFLITMEGKDTEDDVTILGVVIKLRENIWDILIKKT